MKNIRIIPRAKQILVEPKEKESKEQGGIVIPDNVEQEQKSIGTVLAVGAGIDDLKEGDRVIYGAFAGETISFKQDDFEEKEYRILFDEDVIAKVEGDV